MFALGRCIHMLHEIVAVTWMRLSVSFTYLWITNQYQSGLGFPEKAVEGIVSPQRSLYEYVGTGRCTKAGIAEMKQLCSLHVSPAGLCHCYPGNLGTCFVLFMNLWVIGHPSSAQQILMSLNTKELSCTKARGSEIGTKRWENIG